MLQPHLPVVVQVTTKWVGIKSNNRDSVVYQIQDSNEHLASLVWVLMKAARCQLGIKALKHCQVHAITNPHQHCFAHRLESANLCRWKNLEPMAVPGKTLFQIGKFTPVSVHEMRPAEEHKGFFWNSNCAEQPYLLLTEQFWQHLLAQDHPAIIPLKTVFYWMFLIASTFP